MDDLRDVWFFDRFAPYYDRLMAEADSEAIRAGLGEAERDVERVLDLAGGTGRALPGLRLRDPIVLDASRPMLAAARESGYESVQGTATRLPLADDSFDAIVFVDALHLIGAVDEVLAEAERVLGPGGVLVVREIDPSTFKGRTLRTVEHVLGFHSTFLTPGEVSARLEAAGFDARVPWSEWKYTAAGVLPAESETA
jgi:demethylmenaquinone methyltransferase/2-methoxy-6-polyprenyl-1,4-benzoquinol methylase